MAYAIAVNAKPADIARFERRGVKVINLPGSREKYGEVLATTFRELREYWRDNVISVSKVTEEKPLRELLLPRETSSRLCFFSLPLDLMPFYRERIFPLAEEFGFVPVTADEVVSPGDNITAKIDALIDRSAVMIVDVSSRWTLAELHMALARVKGTEARNNPRSRLQLGIVVAKDDLLPAAASGLMQFHRSDVLSEQIEQFIDRIRNWFAEIGIQAREFRTEEPRRLYDAREFRASVIAAMTLLETSLRERLGKSTWTDSRRPMPLRSLIDSAILSNEITQDARPQIDRWMKIRNAAVHTARDVGKNEAREIVEGVEQLLNL
jgi:hypothetical protein